MNAATRLVFADHLAANDVLVAECPGNEVSCYAKAKRHEEGRIHERIVLAVRHVPDLVVGIAVDEDGEQQPLGYGPHALVRVRVGDFPTTGGEPS